MNFPIELLSINFILFYSVTIKCQVQWLSFREALKKVCPTCCLVVKAVCWAVKMMPIKTLCGG